MEIIRRKISLEDGRSRKQGLLPYIPYGEDSAESIAPCKYVESGNTNGNWGHFVINPCVNENGSVVFEDYVALNKKYNTILEVLYRGTKMKRVIKEISGNDGTSSLSWSTLDSYSAYCYTEYQEYDKQLYDFYVVSEDTLSKYNKIGIDLEGLYVVRRGFSYQNNNEYINVLSHDDYETFMKYDDNNYSLCKRMDSYLGKYYIPKTITGELVPIYVYGCDIEKLIERIESYKNSKDCCLKDKFFEYGGDDMLIFLKSTLEDYKKDIDNARSHLLLHNGIPDERCIPKISLNIILTCDYDPIGVGVPYIYDDEYDVSFSGLPYTYKDGLSGITAESLLPSLMDGEKFYDDNEELIPGIFVKYSKESQGIVYESAIFAYNEVSESWEDSNINGYPESYHTVDLAQQIPIDADVEDYYMVRYNNSESVPLRIPYTVNKPKNVFNLTDDNGNYITVVEDDLVLYESIGDFILSIDIDDSTTPNTIHFKYVLAGHFYSEIYSVGSNKYSKFVRYIEDTGTIYEETYNYKQTSDIYTIDGVECEIYYNEIDYDSNKRTVRNDDFRMTRQAVIANVTAAPFMDAFSVNNADNVTNAPVIVPDYMMGITDEISATGAIVLSRGNAAAFEKHFKLTECNTLEDLENYGNNYFNI